MGSKTNMERAKSEEAGFWVTGVVAILVLIFNIAIETDEFTDWDDAFSPWPLFWVIFMFPYAFRAFRALKQHIADLKSGDTKSAPPTEDAPPTREMEKAKSEEQWFWVIGVVAIIFLIFNIYIETDEFTDWRDAFSPWPLFWVVYMFYYAFRGFRALKREIADLKSGDADVSTATQDSE